jgi:hypothetical protein
MLMDVVFKISVTLCCVVYGVRWVVLNGMGVRSLTATSSAKCNT